jgi:hypothetical protein
LVAERAERQPGQHGAGHEHRQDENDGNFSHGSAQLDRFNWL